MQKTVLHLQLLKYTNLSNQLITGRKCDLNKDSRLIRQLSFYTKPAFYPSTVFPQRLHLQRLHSTAAGPLRTELYTTEREGERGTIAIISFFYRLAARWTVHAKTNSWGVSVWEGGGGGDLSAHIIFELNHQSTQSVSIGC